MTKLTQEEAEKIYQKYMEDPLFRLNHVIIALDSILKNTDVYIISDSTEQKIKKELIPLLESLKKELDK